MSISIYFQSLLGSPVEAAGQRDFVPGQYRRGSGLSKGGPGQSLDHCPGQDSQASEPSRLRQVSTYLVIEQEAELASDK